MVEYSWFVFSLGATILFGIAMAFYKIPSFKKQSRYVTAFWTMLALFTLSMIFFYNYLNLSSSKMILTALVWGISFPLLVLLQMWALKHVDTNTLFPITTISSLIITIFAGFLLFGEIVSLLQFFGIILVVFIVYSYLYKKKKIQYSKQVLIIGISIILFSALNKLVHKFAVDNFDFHAYQIYMYLFALIFSFLIIVYFHRKDFKKSFSKNSFLFGSLIGILAFFGTYLFLIALTKGPFTLVTAIHSLYIFVTALTGAFLFKEKLTKKIVLLIILSVIALIIIRIG